MAEKVTRLSAGVTINEIDLSQPTVAGPSGIPAGIIGTSAKGAAFVPTVFANFDDFRPKFHSEF